MRTTGSTTGRAGFADGQADFTAGARPPAPASGALRRLWRAGLWQLLAAVAMIILGTWSARYDGITTEPTGGHLSLPVCGGNPEPEALSCQTSDQAQVIEVVHYGRGDRSTYGLRLHCDPTSGTRCGTWADFGTNVGLTNRVSAGDHVTVVHDAGGIIMEVHYFALSAPTVYSPDYYDVSYGWWLALSDAIGFGACALFFLWRTFVAATARRRTSRQDRWWWVAALLAVAALVIAPVESYRYRRMSDGWLTQYAVAAGAVVAIALLVLAARRTLGVVAPALAGAVPAARLSRRPAGLPERQADLPRRPAAPERPGQGSRHPGSRPESRSSGSRPPASGAPYRVERAGAGGLGPARIRWLLAQMGAEGRIRTDGGIVVSEVDQPALLALVHDVADRLGVAGPDAVLLGHAASVGIRSPLAGGQGVGLSVGLPLALALGTDDLRVAIAHALAVLHEPRPELAARLVALRQRCVDHLDMDGPGRALTRATSSDAVWMLDNTASFARDIESRADEATRRVCGSATGAGTALLRIAVLRRDFDAISREFAPDQASPVYPARLYSGWAGTLPTGPSRRWIPQLVPGVATEMARHVGLAGAIRTIDPASWPRLVTGRPGTPVVTVDPATEATLAARHFRATTGVPTELEPIPWAEYDAEEAYDPLQVDPRVAAGGILGRPATTDDVLTLVAAGRGPEVAAAWTDLLLAELDDEEDGDSPSDLGEDEDEDDDEDGGESTDGMLYALLNLVLHERGYRCTDVLRPDELTDPAGRHADLAEVLGDGTDADPARRIPRIRAFLAHHE